MCQKGGFEEAVTFISGILSQSDIPWHATLELLCLEQCYSNYSQKLVEQCLMVLPVGLTSVSVI